MNKNMTTRLAAYAAIVIGAALTLRAAEVTEAVAKEAVAGWASLQEALTAKDRFAGAAVAKVETFSGVAHVVVKVLPGGNAYRIYLLEAHDESMNVLSVVEKTV